MDGSAGHGTACVRNCGCSTSRFCRSACASLVVHACGGVTDATALDPVILSGCLVLRWQLRGADSRLGGGGGDRAKARRI
jgi:hypothetical protein